MCFCAFLVRLDSSLAKEMAVMSPLPLLNVQRFSCRAASEQPHKKAKALQKKRRCWHAILNHALGLRYASVVRFHVKKSEGVMAAVLQDLFVERAKANA